MISKRLAIPMLLLFAPALSGAVRQEQDGRVVVEAENFASRTVHDHGDGDIHHWHVAPDEDFAGDAPHFFDFSDLFLNARGDKYVQLLPNSAGGSDPGDEPHLDFRVFLQTPGTYQFYARWASLSGSDDSFYVEMPQLKDGAGGVIADWYRFSEGDDGDSFAIRGWRGQGGFERTDASGDDVPATWEITEPGLYTVRVTQREDGAALDAIMLQLTSLPAPSDPGPAQSPTTTDFPPFISARSPSPGEASVALDAPVRVEITEGADQPLDPSTVTLSVNGNTVAHQISKSGEVSVVTGAPSEPLPGQSAIPVSISFNGLTRSWEVFTERGAVHLPPLRQSDAGLVVIEAEDFNANVARETHSWQFQSASFGAFASSLAPGFSGEGAMYVLPDGDANFSDPAEVLTQSPRLDFEVEFKDTGTHYVWFRGSDGGGDSLHVGLDGELPETGIRIDAGCCGDRNPGGTTWAWVGDLNGSVIDPNGVDSPRARLEVASPGVHTVSVWMREDGILVDKLVIASDPDFVPTDAGPPQSRRVGEPERPIVSVTSPAQDAQLPAGAAVTVTAEASDPDGTVVKVEFFESGTKFGEATSAPYSAVFNASVERPHVFTARAVDASGDSAMSSDVRVVVGTPKRALFLLNLGPNASDAFVRDRLESRFHLGVTLVDDNDSQPSDADGMDLIVISSTVSSGQIADKFTFEPVPIVQWEEALVDDLLLGGNSDSGPDSHGTTGDQTELEIVNANHPLAAGLAEGIHTIYTSPQTVSWGFPEPAFTPGVTVIAQAPDNPEQMPIFAYDQGDILWDAFTPAPDRRVMLFVNNESAPAMSRVGLNLFDAAISWALRIPFEPEPEPSEPPELSLTRDGAQLSLSWSESGTLQSAAEITGPWQDAPDQANPQTIPAAGARKFFRVTRR